jgi:hypothetical protein
MTQLAAWIAVCLVVALILRSHPVHGICVVIIVWVAVPAVAGHLLTGRSTGSLAFHPATWLVLAIFAVQLLLRPAVMLAAVGRHAILFLVLAIFTLGAFLSSRIGNSGGTRLLLDQIIGPFLLFWVVVAAAHQQRRTGLLLRNTVLFVVAAECVLALVQQYLGRILFYEDDYLRLYWFNLDRFDRWMGTTDSPLILSLAICIAGALTVGLRNWVLRFGLLVLYLIGTTITQSRTGTALMCLIILYSILRSRMAFWARALTTVALVVAGYFIAASDLVSGLASRLTNDTGSADARLRAFQFFTENWTSYLATGYGLTSSYNIARDSGLQTSIESSYLMYVVDTGLILATAYFGAQFALLLRYGNQTAYLGASLAALVGTVLQHTFSGVAGTNLAGTLIWTALAMMVVGRSVSVASTASTSSGAPKRAAQPYPAAPSGSRPLRAIDLDKVSTSSGR